MYKCRHTHSKVEVDKKYRRDTLGYCTSPHLQRFKVKFAHYSTIIPCSYLHLCKRTMASVRICSQHKCTLFLQCPIQNQKMWSLPLIFQHDILFLLGLLRHTPLKDYLWTLKSIHSVGRLLISSQSSSVYSRGTCVTRQQCPLSNFPCMGDEGSRQRLDSYCTSWKHVPCCLIDFVGSSSKSNLKLLHTSFLDIAQRLLTFLARNIAQPIRF